jgi:EAL domain-containing protein (putative c-di-GMP-specific phosphodiesterase class I)/GGDEF domain-containing protein
MANRHVLVSIHMKISLKPILLSRLGYVIVSLLLAVLLMLIYQLITAISDPTQKAFTLDDTLNPIAITTAYHLDSSGEVTLEHLISDPSLLHPNISQIPWSFEQQAYWLALQLNNRESEKQDLVLHLDNLMLEQLKVYQLDSDGQVIETHSLGWQQQSLSREQRSMPHISFTLQPQQTTQFYIRIQTEGIAKTPVKIYLQEDFNRLAQFIFLLWGIFAGILIMTAMYNLVLYTGLKDPIYLVYVGYILSILIMYGVVIGFGHYIWPEMFIRLIREHIVSANISALMFTVSFTVLFFNAQNKKNKVTYFAFAYLVGLLFLAIISWWLPEYVAAPLFFLSMVIMYPLAFTLIGRQLASDFSWAKLYVLSWIPLMIGGSVQPMELLGILPYTFFIHHALMIGVLIEIVLMAIALAERMRHKKELVLYDATHHLETLLPNRNLFDQALQDNAGKNIAVCLIEISEFHTLLPYISNTDNNDITIMMATNIERQIHDNDQFITVESKKEQRIKLAKIQDGVFGIIYLFDIEHALDNQRLGIHLLTMQRAVAKGVHINDLFINLSTRVGVSLSSTENESHSPNEMIKQSFQALEQSKRSGRHVSFFQQEDALNIARRLSLAADLQKDLNANKLELFHQPQINLQDNSVDGSEVLLRWKHNKLGYIPPDTFIELAEDTGIINELTLWVIDSACKHLVQLIELGFSNHNVSINISGKDIAEVHFLSNVKNILNNYTIPLEKLTFELTESVMVNDFHHLSQTMNELSDMGINVSIDDYGTGYSSLVYISQLPFNEIKIDKSFIIPLVESDRNNTIVKTTIDMAKSLNLKVIAEGVETAEIEAELKQHQCHIAQGYFYSKPVSFKNYVAWLKHRLI